MAPKNTPEKIVTDINREITEFLQQAAARQRLAEVGQDMMDEEGPQEFARLMDEENVFWKKVVEETGVKVN